MSSALKLCSKVALITGKGYIGSKSLLVTKCTPGLAFGPTIFTLRISN